jgi:hypothetical protein
MYAIFDIYKTYRMCQGNFKKVGYRLPKDWDGHYKNKMLSENKRILETITAYFNTKWNSIDPEKYFNIGFSLFGNKFSYRKFLDKKVLLQYIQNDKNEKRRIGEISEDIKRSADFINKLLNSEDRGSKIVRYCSMKDGYMSLPVIHYIEGKISKAFMILIMWHGLLKPSEDELNKMPYVTAHYNEIISNFNQDTLKLLCKVIL